MRSGEAEHRLGTQSTITGREFASRDWSDTVLGPIEGWSPALTSLLAMMLACPTPMYLAWGPELTSFFNDAYRSILGQRLPGALGRPFRELWGDIWDDIGPLVDVTLAGESRSMVDMKLDLARQGMPESSWWSFTYSPVRDIDGRIAGLLCVTAETTQRVLAEQARDEASERLDMALAAGRSIGTWDWSVADDHVTADTRFALLYGVDPARAATGAPIAEFFGGIHPDDLPRVQEGIRTAMATGGDFVAEYRITGEAGVERWVSAQGRCIHDETGRPVRFPGVSFDITDRVRASRALEHAKEERDFIVALLARQRELDSPELILRLSAESLGPRLGAERCGSYRALADDRLRFGPCWTAGTLPVLTGDHDGTDFGPRFQSCWRQGTVLTFADAMHDPVGGLDAQAQLGVTAGICVPVMRGGRLSAGLYVHDTRVRAWTAGEVALVREVAEMTMLAVERAEALIRLRARLGQQEDVLAQTTGELRDQVAGRSAAEAGRTAAESQVRQMQKMEAVGQLTGGIAHDFNNMLAVIIGGLNLMQRRLARGDTNIARYVDAAMDGAHRAAALTQRLLAFSRQAPLAPEPLDVNRMVGSLADLLTRTLGEQTRLETVLSAGLWKAKADPNQLENVIVNLAVNARDAMPNGGRLTIETNNAHMDDAYASAEDTVPGQYVMIAVTDTGTGMTPDVMARAFDPFFTTKGVGKGTGLGLSQVFGFARQSGGHVKCYSEVGHGTTFRIYLPRFVGDAPAAPIVRRTSAEVRGGQRSEVILVVEDEERLRTFTVETLREFGYTVVHAGDGEAALALIGAGQDVTLLFTDIVMPGMTGRELADVAVSRIPALKVLYTTGYTRNAVVHNGTLDPGTNFLAKPFGIDQLAAKIREVLDQN